MQDLELLVKLGLVIVVAVGAVLLLLQPRVNPDVRGQELVLGYPADLFPARGLTRTPPLVALAATQARLVSIYRQLPADSDLAIWLRAFLNELREIMDTAYRVTVITEVYGQPAQIERLIAEVEQIEQEVATHVAHRLLARDGDAQHELLDGRLAALRMCVRELACLPDVRPSLFFH